MVTVRLPHELGKKVEDLVARGKFLNKTEFVRAAVREKIEREEGRAA
jgi:Arc/MetJ-type ribon-helix-helix transcriptional regulator